MTAEKLADALLSRCDIYYGDALISREAILEKYLSFFADSLVAKERTVNFALHTGSVCFDVVSIVAVALGCLSYNLSTNDDILSSLQDDEMVMYDGQRYRWKGLKTMNGQIYMTIEQDGKGRNGNYQRSLPYERNKHLVKPYYGGSKITDGRGIRKAKTNREEFLSSIFDIPQSEIPTEIDVSIVIVAERAMFADICRNVRIEYADDKHVGLLDVVPAAYYTSGGEELQFGNNPAKAEPVLKVASKVSTARDLVLDRHGNKAVGLLVTGAVSIVDNAAELTDLLRRKSLRFVHVTSPMKPGLGEHILELYGDASLLACTKSFLEQHARRVRISNPLTLELQRQIGNVVGNTVVPIVIPGGWNWSEYRALKNALLNIRQSHWQDERKEDFLACAQSVVNLLNTAVFSMSDMESAIAEAQINPDVTSPKARIEKLWDIADGLDTMQEVCAIIADAVETKYKQMMNYCPKLNALEEYVIQHCDDRIAIVVPKAYYVDLLRLLHPRIFNVSAHLTCVTANRFDAKNEYDIVIVVGELNNKRFDPLQCLSAKTVAILLYGCEERLFSYRKKKKAKHEHKLNTRSGLAPNGTLQNESDESDDEVVEQEMRQFASLDEYISNYNLFDVRKLGHNASTVSGYSPLAEVKYIGSFTTGEQILFSKFYSAVVFDGKSVSEKTPDQLAPGDTLVFAKRDDYTKNMVDFVYEKLLLAGRLGQHAGDVYEKSVYWKEALREYKEIGKYTYRNIAKQLRELGSSIQEVTVRQWLVADSHIVGPRDELTMACIAQLTKDPYLLGDVHGYFEACREVRHERRAILDLIAKAINEKLSGRIPATGSALEVVYDNVENLSETLELENVVELDESAHITINLVNRPITEAEVSV